MEKNSIRSNQTHIIVQCAMFLAIAVALNALSQMLPIAGVANGLKISISPIFKKIPCLLFGPWYGAAVCVFEDVLSNMVFFPKGAPIIWLTVVYALQGFMIGFLYKLINKIWRKKQTFADLFLKILIVFLIADTVKTVLSSVVLVKTITSFGKKGFWLVFAPRMIEEIFSIFICAYIDAYLIRVYNRIKK